MMYIASVWQIKGINFKLVDVFSDARSITVGFLGVLFPLSVVEEPPPLAPLGAGIPQICSTGSPPPPDLVSTVSGGQSLQATRHGQVG